MSYAKFSDAFKASADLLKKPYLEVNKLELKGGDKPSFTGEAVLGEGVGEKAPALALKAENLNLAQVKVDKVSADSNALVSAEFSLSEAFAGTKLTFVGTDATKAAFKKAKDQKVSAVFGVEHKAAFGTFTLNADPLDHTAKLTALGGFEGFFGGVSIETAGAAVKDYAPAFGWKSASTTIGVTSEKSKGSEGAADLPMGWAAANFYHKVSDLIEIAGAVKVQIAEPKDIHEKKSAPAPAPAADAEKSEKTHKAAAVEAAVGLKYKLNAETTVAGKVVVVHGAKSTRELLLSYAQKLSPIASITISSSFNLGHTVTGKADNSTKLSLSLLA